MNLSKQRVVASCVMCKGGETHEETRRLVVLMLVIVLLFTCMGVTAKANSQFEDVKPGKWYYKAVMWAVENGVASGTSETTFSPNAVCTRGQIVTFLWKAAGSPNVDDVENPFADVSKKKYYYKPVLWAYSNQITSGTSPTTFSPNAECTRGQIVSFLWKAREAQVVDVDRSSFTDVKIGKYYEKPVYWAVMNGITGGVTNTEFEPNTACTRAQAVGFIYKCFSGVTSNTPSAGIHLYKVDSTVAATCISPKILNYHCIFCHEKRSFTSGKALGHDYKLAESVPSTYSACGYDLYKCARCNDSYKEEKELLHSWYRSGSKAPTCTTPGYKEYACYYCSAKRYEELPTVPHSFNSTYITYPRPDRTGVKRCVCRNCGYTENQNVVIDNAHGSYTNEEKQLVALINSARAAKGLAPLTLDTTYYAGAALRCYELIELFSHTRPNGTAFHTVFSDMNMPTAWSYGENICYSFSSQTITVEQIHQQFMNSSGHRENLLKDKWESVSVYILRIGGYAYCVENFFRTSSPYYG